MFKPGMQPGSHVGVPPGICTHMHAYLVLTVHVFILKVILKIESLNVEYRLCIVCMSVQINYLYREVLLICGGSNSNPLIWASPISKT